MSAPQGARFALGRRDVLRAAAGVPLLGPLRSFGSFDSPGRADGPLPKNVLVLVSDDQSRGDVGAYGNRHCTTPRLDRLAAEGVRFERAYTQTSICRPARATLFTGLEAHRHGATGFSEVREGVTNWPELLGPEGATALIGKQGGAPSSRMTFEFVRGGSDASWRQPSQYAEALREFLGSIGERRFAAVVAFQDPHRPFWEGWPVGPRRPHRAESIEEPAYLLKTAETRDELAKYYDAINRLDKAVGAVLDELDAAGRAGDTLVIFTSDNGTPFPFGKTTLYEAGINLPFIARWPEVIAPDTVNRSLVALKDLLPTALDAFGLPAPGTLQGRSLLPLLRGESESIRDVIYLEHDEHRRGHGYPMRGLCTERFKYIRNLRPELTFENSVTGFSDDPKSRPSSTWKSWTSAASDDEGFKARLRGFQHRPPEELFDLGSDPFELENLASHAELEPELARFRGLVRAWLEREEDPLLSEWDT